MQKIREKLSDPKNWRELIRYIIAGGLTTLLSLAVSFGCYILLSENHTINGANTVQLMIGNTISWIVAVVFAFWINRRMVFRVKGGNAGRIRREFLEFIAARAASWALLEEGFAALLKLMGLNNVINRLTVMVLVTVFNYVASKFWVFKNPHLVADAAQEGAQSGGSDGAA